MIPQFKPRSLIRLSVIALLIGAAGFVIVPRLLAVPGGAPMTATNAPAATTNAMAGATNAATASTGTTTPATNTASATPASSTNAAPVATTNAAPATASATGTQTDEAPAGPGEMSGTPVPEPAEPIGPPVPNSEQPGQVMPFQSNSPAVEDITNKPGEATALGRRKLPFSFGLDVGEMYDDNILIAPSNQKKGSFITHVAPSIEYQLGDIDAVHMNYLDLYFSPTVFIYHNQDREDRIDYNGDINYQYTWTRLKVGVEQKYEHLTDASLDEGTLVSRNIYTTNLTASYAYNDDLTLFGTGTQQISNYPGITTNEWVLDTYALYQVAPKLQLGAGPRVTFLDIAGAPNETREDLLFRLRYNPDQRVTVTFDGGGEYLQYQSGNADKIVPVFDAVANYAFTDDTSVFLSAGRTELNSYDLRGDLFDFTTVSLGASQKFLNNFTFTATGGYSLSEYQSTQFFNGSQTRRDNYFYGKASVEWDPNNWLKVEASYQYQKDNSTIGSFTFTDNQIDLQSSVKF